MAEFDPDAYLAKKRANEEEQSFDPDAYLASKGISSSPTPIPSPTQEPQIQENAPYPDLYTRLYEQNVVIPMRAARHLAPFPETIQENVIDPTIGFFTGESAEERKKNRAAYDRYLRETYPTAYEAYESRGRLAGGLVKGGFVGATEPITEQIITEPESFGMNPETALNAIPLVGGALAAAPKGAAKATGYMKSRPDQRQSLRAYEANPEYYDSYEASTGGKPIKALETEMQQNLAQREVARNQSINELTPQVENLRQEDARQVAKAIDDIKRQTELGTYEGDKMVAAAKALQQKYKNTAATRNRILEESGGEIPIDTVRPLFQDAYNTVYSPQDRAAILNAWKELSKMARHASTSGFANVQIGTAPKVISARELDRMRQIYQNSVDYSPLAHNQPYQHKLNSIANDLNDILDMSIPKNEPLRAQIREETIRFKKARELFGGEYPLKKFQSAAKDPMMRRDLENLGIPEIQDILKTIDYRENFQRNLKLGEKPKSDVIEEYLRKKKDLEAVKSQQLPMSSLQAPSALESAMMETYRNPKLNAENKVRQYAEQVHPQGPEDFYRKMEATKVLRDVEGLNTAQGSRFTNLVGSAGAATGGLIGAGLDSPGVGAAIGSAMGGAAGAALDYRASNMFRGGLKMGQKLDPYRRAITTGGYLGAGEENRAKAVVPIPYDKLAGTKYEPQFIAVADDPKKAAVLHYMLSQKDPEYAALTSGEEKIKELALPKYGGIGADIGNMIDSAIWTDQIGLDPHEKEADGFQYGEGVPQPSSIKPFSFRKIFPSKSAVGSEVKVLPRIKKTGVNGENIYRELEVPAPFERFSPKTITMRDWERNIPEKVMERKLALKDKAEGKGDDIFTEFRILGPGAVYPDKNGIPVMGYGRTPTAIKHEHIHNQIEGLNRIDPMASLAYDWYLQNKAKNEYDIPIHWITDQMHGTHEFMTIMGDLLEDKKTRIMYGIMPEIDERVRQVMRNMRKFYTDVATEAQNMTEKDVLNIVDKFKNRRKSL